MTVPPLSRLSAAALALARTDEVRAKRIATRDAAIVAALASGATWAEVQEAANLTPRGVQLAIRRHKQRGSP